MNCEIYSYRFAEEILEHENYEAALQEILGVIRAAPVFTYPGKSRNNAHLDIVQQVLNTYFDRRLAVDHGWDYHPLATKIEESNLKADFRKTFGSVTIQAEVQFGNMARWYSDIFKFQTAYSQGMIQLALSIIPMCAMAKRIDSNIVNYERATRELPSAELSITLPILMVGVYPDADTDVVDISECGFETLADITRSKAASANQNRWRIVNGYINGVPMHDIGPDSNTGPIPAGPVIEED